MLHPTERITAILLVAFIVTAVPTTAQSEIGERTIAGGSYIRYLPANPRNILVIAHGSIGANDTAIKLANKFLRRWTRFADETDMLLIAPAFDRANYQVGHGGYRGLFGRNIGADEFVLDAVRVEALNAGVDSGRFYLYGHSAGGQFAVRFLVRHSNLLNGVVLSAPGRYAFPNPQAPWPYGMGRLQREISWPGRSQPQRVDIRSDTNAWRLATRIPTTVVVGAQDLEPQPERPGHRGSTRVDLAIAWVYDMKQLNRAAPYRTMLVDGIGHSSKRLTPHAQQALRDQLSAATTSPP